MVAARIDIEKAVEILKQVPPQSEFFTAAKIRMANLYLTYRQNRQMYANCFEELVEEVPTPQSYFHLGEAYTNIHEPEKAIAAYQQAKTMDPDNSELDVRIGRALVSTHDYQRAVRYYRDAVAGDGATFTVLADLATLYWHLGAPDRAIGVLKETPAYRTEPDAEEDVKRAIERVNCTLLMYKIHRSCQKPELAVEALLQARGFQEHVLHNLLRNETRETMYQQKIVASTIALELGDYYASIGDVERGKECYQAAKMYDESNEAPLLAIARLLLDSGDAAACEERCNAVLQMNPASSEAVIILADVMIHRYRFEEAAQHFSQLLEKFPDNYEALVQYVRLLRHAGRLGDAEKALERAEGLVPVGQRPPSGLSFARGLYHRYCYENLEALRAFNAARVPADDAVWSTPALTNMIEMYLFSSNEEFWVDTVLRDEDKNENVRVAERLLLQMPQGESRDILQGYCWLASKKRPLVDRAIKEFTQLCAAAETAAQQEEPANDEKGAEGEEKDEDEQLLSDVNRPLPPRGRPNVPARVGLAIACFIAGLEKRAAAEIKQIVYTPFDPLTTDAVHRARLLAAHMSILKKKLPAAQKFLEKNIEVNKSCAQTWLMMGSVHELGNNHTEAANCYENAWELTKERDPSVGYKLAFHRMKSGKLVAAIDVCRKVLDVHPSYPKIHEVLDACRGLLRP
ncbi:hypothetical protein TRSC58_03979 [Trypanosoma rangeli SC58]|uniref:Uncharacterized protein n=1 Tax=Trypanosoma rangeli SC58 TaxID=429131 RepID=A0A061J1X0_TRYRA|nr:hypothetical protein TRSC58_03979 [Trypanosoma rangeli SC58]